MDNRTNTIAGWVLAGCIAALGLTVVSSKIFAHDPHEKQGYPVEAAEEGAAAGAAEVPIATLLASADVAAGQATFGAKCGSCHTAPQGGANGVGPNLYGTLGEPIGQGKGGFPFSDALKGVGGNWDFEKMNAWLTSPRKFAPGTKMTFPGFSDGKDRANVIAYINSLGSNLPLPAAPAAAAPAEGNAATANVANEAAPAPGAPSQDPQAAVQAEKKGK